MLEATSNSMSPVTGSLTFSEATDGSGVLSVTVAVDGLPDGNHGYHVHTYGDISNPSGMSTGGSSGHSIHIYRSCAGVHKGIER